VIFHLLAVLLYFFVLTLVLLSLSFGLKFNVCCVVCLSLWEFELGDSSSVHSQNNDSSFEIK
jgi:hypothetical protein